MEKLREKRAFEASLPPIDDFKNLPLRRRMLEEWEKKEWVDREQEILELQEKRLAIFCAALDRREAQVRPPVVPCRETARTLLSTPFSLRLSACSSKRSPRPG